jgi:hypothetical protein
MQDSLTIPESDKDTLRLSCADSARASIHFVKTDCRVKPGNDGLVTH